MSGAIIPLPPLYIYGVHGVKFTLFYLLYFDNSFFLLLVLTRIFLTTKQRRSETSLQTPVSHAETVVISTYQETSVNSSDTNASSAKLSCKSFRFRN